jgi:hypothetical protein
MTNGMKPYPLRRWSAECDCCNSKIQKPHMRADVLLPFEPDALGVLRTVSQGRVEILLGKAHELLNAAAERGLPRIDSDFASRYFQGAVDTSDAAEGCA